MGFGCFKGGLICSENLELDSKDCFVVSFKVIKVDKTAIDFEVTKITKDIKAMLKGFTANKYANWFMED